MLRQETGVDTDATKLADGPRPADSDDSRSAIDRAWQRCLSHGISPGQDVQFESVGRATLAELEDRHAGFLSVAHPHLQWMSRGVAEAGGVVLLTNARGTILRRYGRFDLAAKDLELASRVGVTLDERCVGSSAPGIAVAEKSPIVVSGSQHFCGSLRNFHCLAVPIEDARGELLGAIDITSYARPLAFDAMSMAVDVVRAVENSMFEPTGDMGQASFHIHPGLMNSNSAGMLLIDDTWTIVAANRAARMILGCLPSGLIGYPFADMFDPERGLDALHAGRGAMWRTRCGLTLFGQVRWAGESASRALHPSPAQTNAASSAVAEIPGHSTDFISLRDSEARSIELALQRTQGKVAEAAKLLGISRQTIYRRLKR